MNVKVQSQCSVAGLHVRFASQLNFNVKVLLQGFVLSVQLTMTEFSYVSLLCHPFLTLRAGSCTEKLLVSLIVSYKKL